MSAGSRPSGLGTSARHQLTSGVEASATVFPSTPSSVRSLQPRGQTRPRLGRQGDEALPRPRSYWGLLGICPVWCFPSPLRHHPLGAPQ